MPIDRDRMDIVDYLRVWEAGAVGRPALYEEAADEIERLWIEQVPWREQSVEGMEES